MNYQHIVVLLLALFVALDATATTVSYDDMARAGQSPSAQDGRAAFDAATDAAALAAAIRRVLHDGGIAPLAREALLVDGALRLANAAPESIGDSLLETLTQRPVSIYVAHEHAGRSSRIPAYDVAAAARYAIERRARYGRARGAVHALRSGKTLAAIGPATPATPAAPTLDALAVSQLDRRTLQAAIAQLKLALPGSPELAAAATAAALRAEDDALLVAVLRHGDDPAALEALRAASSLRSASARVDTIEAAIARPHTAAAALSALAEIARNDPGYAPRLLPWLERPDTAFAAAAAIAQLDRPDHAAAIADRLDGETQPQRAAALALALTLMKNETAARRLDAYLEAPGGFAQLKRKIASTRGGVRP